MATNTPPAPTEKEQAEGSRKIIDHELEKQDKDQKSQKGGGKSGGGSQSKD